ncbi:M15 family metallopeptidase [Vibrio sp. SCSIO 43136]|uniref:M15 family metallopeptidase n=1 Tax=Vibrio sp. SCSIO 43136 TaxID=2819101 RepID=UPI0020760DEE|nr:M15 family metallopeptidase [Vibrio sp. SCSIO 43136]USD68121.1 M15 family metallopeptidase [Vibrio sp. SCSIO 43136]
MKKFYLGKRSLTRLHKLHPIMAAVVSLAITLTDVDFSVSETVRTLEKQKKLYYGEPKRTWTMDSKHLIQEDGFAHAVDLIPLDKHGQVDWSLCPAVKDAIFAASKILGVKIRWGGDWNMNGSSKDEHQRGSFDGPHFELLT